MHKEVDDWLRSQRCSIGLSWKNVRILEIGSYNVNGSARRA